MDSQGNGESPKISEEGNGKIRVVLSGDLSRSM